MPTHGVSVDANPTNLTSPAAALPAVAGIAASDQVARRQQARRAAEGRPAAAELHESAAPDAPVTKAGEVASLDSDLPRDPPPDARPRLLDVRA